MKFKVKLIIDRLNMGKIIQRDRSIIPACDVSLDAYEEILRATSDIAGVGAYKVGFELGLEYSLPKVVELARKYCNKPIIYDHQKAGTDIPDTGKHFARTMKHAGIDAVIFFPQSGPEAEKAWIESAFEHGLGVIVGGLMTHPRYTRSEGGYIADESILEMYLNAAELGVSDFVVPGNKPEAIKIIRKSLEEKGVSPLFYMPGFETQESISKASKVIGSKWHAILGRVIYESENIRKSVLEYISYI